MAKKVITEITCDGCKKKGQEVPGTVSLTIMGDEYDLCHEHGSKFRALLAEALGDAEAVALSA
ncbi:hypothetical protein ABT115_08810 [Streptomyces sp. NPDC001832]|uniref:hypothetical protein n=1 Tax=Streptomyces sp. NPDC001832 TaxID=3154527 RepID=UPI00332D37D5